MPHTTQPTITEYSILSSYLLNPSPLPQILSFTEFVKTCVPAQHRSNPLVKRLYRDLQFQRNVDVDAIRENIERECSQAGILKGRLAAKIAMENGPAVDSQAKKRKRNQTDDMLARAGDEQDSHLQDEEGLGAFRETHVSATINESNLHPAASSLPSQPSTSAPRGSRHTVPSLLTAVDVATHSLEDETHDLEEHCESLIKELQETVGQLSDLRYGRLNRPLARNDEDEADTFEASIIDALRQLETAAKRGTAPAPGDTSDQRD